MRMRTSQKQQLKKFSAEQVAQLIDSQKKQQYSEDAFSDVVSHFIASRIKQLSEQQTLVEINNLENKKKPRKADLLGRVEYKIRPVLQELLHLHLLSIQ